MRGRVGIVRALPGFVAEGVRGAGIGLDLNPFSLSRSGPEGNHFGLIAQTSLKLPKGRWRFRTNSDDGVRVLVNGRPVIENWTWHVPTNNDGVFESAGDSSAEIVVECFEIDGFATLRLDIEPVK